MKKRLSGLLLFFFLFIALYSPAQNQRQMQPDDVILTSGAYQLKYKHLLAYIAGELTGEDPAMYNDQEVIKELTQECLEEFAEDPGEMLADLDEQYEQLIAGQTAGGGSSGSGYPSPPQNNDFGAAPANGDVAQWKQTLSGAALQYAYQESYSGGVAQGKQVLHLCPDGSFFIIGYSAVSGSFSSGDVLDRNQGQLMEQGQWNVVRLQGMVCIQLTEKGVPYTVPLSVVNNKVMLQGIALMDYYPNAAQCR